MADKKIKNLFRGVSTVSIDILQKELKDISLLKRKAMDSRNICDTFCYSDAILNMVNACGGIKMVSKTSWQRGNPKVWSQFQSELFTWMLMMVFHKQENSDKNWSLIFYEYMVAGNRSDLLTPIMVREYHDLLANTMDCLPPDVRETAEELCRFFECHGIDPYSCVIGQSPSKEILKFSLSISDKSLSENLPYDIFDSSAAPSKSKINYQRKYEDVLSRIVYWSTISQESAMQYLSQTASSIRGVHRLARGSLVLVRMNPILATNSPMETTDHWIYARIAGKAEGSLVLVYLNPEESIVVSFEVDRVIPVAPEMCYKYFCVKDYLSLEKCVETTIDAAYAKILNYCGDRATIYLKDNGITTEVIELAFKNLCTLRQFTELKDAVKILIKPVPGTVLQQVETVTRKIVSSSIRAAENGSKYECFQPTHRKNAEQLRVFDGKKVFVQELKQYKGVCEMSIENIEIQKREILSGNKKKELSDAWLRNIDDSVNNFLIKHGFECDAVPTHYLDEPPISISAVRRNLVLLRRVLKSQQTENDIFKLNDLIDSLCVTTYRIIDDFIESITYCIALSLNVSLESLPKSNPAIIQQINSARLDETLKRNLINIVKDKEYLLDMKRMESDIEFAQSQRMVTIPVSGLVMSKLCRLENEHKSVLDLWEPALISKAVGESRSPLECAVLKNDSKQVEQLLKSGSAYVNEPDSNGWTALHLACSYSMNQPRLEVTQTLLDFIETDAMIENNYGNTALHYYAHIPVGEDIRTQYRNIILKFTKDPKILFHQNHKGETPLHRAALSANPVAARFLLECGADPNFANEDGSTPLHYAVQSANKECVCVLIKHFANHTQANIAGESPLDIALKLNLSDLIKILSETEWTSEKHKQATHRSTNRRNNRVSRVDRRTIFQQKNVPDQVLDLVKFGSSNVAPSVNISTSVGNWKKPAIPPEVLAALNETNNSSSINTKDQWTKPAIPPEVLAALNELEEEQKPGPRPGSKPQIDFYELNSKELRKTPIPQAAPLPPVRIVRDEYRIALWDVTAEDNDEISFKKGDRIRVIAKDSSGWWTGQLSSGKKGIFPENYTVSEAIYKAQQAKDISSAAQKLNDSRASKSNQTRIRQQSPIQVRPNIKNSIDVRGKRLSGNIGGTRGTTSRGRGRGQFKRVQSANFIPIPLKQTGNNKTLNTVDNRKPTPSTGRPLPKPT